MRKSRSAGCKGPSVNQAERRDNEERQARCGVGKGHDGSKAGREGTGVSALRAKQTPAKFASERGSGQGPGSSEALRKGEETIDLIRAEVRPEIEADVARGRHAHRVKSTE